MAHDIFISYASQDQAVADAACASLEAGGIRCWIAPRDVVPGEDYPSALVRAIHESKALVLILSSHSNQSSQVARELERAASRSVPILPFRIEEVAPSTSVEFFISRTHWLDALTLPVEKHFGRLAETVRALVSDQPPEQAETGRVAKPRIQYAKTTGGVSIAFSAVGEGKPLVHMPNIASHLRLEWDVPECRRWYESLARRYRLVRFDLRGVGLSDRDISLSATALDDYVQDLEAVIDRLGLEPFAIFAQLHSVPITITYAVRHPERVSHLVLWSGYATAGELTKSPVVQASRSLIDKDWVFYSETLARVHQGWSEGEPARRYASLLRQSVTQDMVSAFLATAVNWDVSSLLRELRTPTLVLQRDEAIPGVDVASSLAARISDSRLVILEGGSMAPYLGDTEAAVAAVEEFLSENEVWVPARQPSSR